VITHRDLELTISLATGGCGTLADLTLVLQVEVPALLLTLGVLQIESNNGLSLVDGILAIGLVGLESLVDHVERGGGREGILKNPISKRFNSQTRGYSPFLRGMVSEVVE